MLFWFISFVCLLFGLREAFRDGSFARGRPDELVTMARIRDSLHHFEETLASGNLPEERDWERLFQASAPWGALFSESLPELRAQGASLVPTLKRFRELAVSHEKNLRDAKARASGAMSQALICACLIPVFGAFLYLLVPGVDERPIAWTFLCLLASGMGGVAATWLLGLAESARWGGLKKDAHPRVLESLGFCERLIALLRSGLAPDLAWARAVDSLSPELTSRWGADVWRRDPEDLGAARSLDESIASLGSRLRRAIQVGLLEGTPCEERLESVAQSLRAEIRAFQERELGLLGSRALKPLFLCVAPAVLSLLVIAVFVSFRSQGGF